jgi:lysozyme
MSRLTASRAAFDLIASFEGFRTRAVVAPNGKWTLGFGHVATAREGLNVTRAEAEDLLRWDLLPIEDSLRQVALTPLTQNQFDALLSFAFNIGLENFKRSDVLKYLNQGQPTAAALSMHAWRRARVNGRVLTIDALVRRRAAEAALFLEPVGARAAAPTSIIVPELDQSATLSFAQIEPTGEGRTDTEKSVVAPDVPAHTPKDDGPATPPPADAEIKATPVQPPIAQPPKTTPQTPKATSLPQMSTQDVLRDALRPELNARPNPILPPSPTGDAKPIIPAPIAQAPKPKMGPIVPNGIAPFPAGPAFDMASTPANTNGNGAAQNLQNMPANDGYNTRLHAAPEAVDVPTGTKATRPSQKSVPAVDGFTLLTWALMALGAALLAFGLFYSWKSGLLSVASPKREPTGSELSALLAAGSGFIILITAAVAAITRQGQDNQA